MGPKVLGGASTEGEEADALPTAWRSDHFAISAITTVHQGPAEGETPETTSIRTTAVQLEPCPAIRQAPVTPVGKRSLGDLQHHNLTRPLTALIKP